MTITFRQFVEWYWKKLQRNGSGWTIDEIMEDCGITRDYATMFNDFCLAKGGGLTDGELVNLFESGYQVSHTPFGDTITALPGAAVGPANFANFIIDLKALIARYAQ